MEDARRYWITVLATLALAIVGAGTFNWKVDPLQFFRRSNDPVFFENQRFQNPGLAKHYNYKLVVVGNSYVENYTPRKVEEYLGRKALKLAISGSTAHEQALILEKALATGKPREVVWGLTYNTFRHPADAVRHDKGRFPLHLYDESPLGNLDYLLSIDTVELSLQAKRGEGVRDLEQLNTWRKLHFSEGRVIRAWTEMEPMLVAYTAEEEAARVDASIELNLVEPIRSNPEVSFRVFFAPHSIVHFLDDVRRGEDALERRLAFKRKVAVALEAFPNVKLYDFQAKANITHDLSNYRDMTHFRPRVTSWVLQMMREERGRVDARGMEKQLTRLRKQVGWYAMEVCQAKDELASLCGPEVEQLARTVRRAERKERRDKEKAERMGRPRPSPKRRGGKKKRRRAKPPAGTDPL